MDYYLIQETFKPEAWNYFLENPQAAEGWTALFTKNFEAMNGKLHGIWFSHENCDLIMVVEMPNALDVSAVAVTAFSRRFVQAMKVSPLWPAAELPGVLKKVLAVPPPVSSQLDEPPAATLPQTQVAAPGSADTEIRALYTRMSIFELTERYPDLIDLLANMGFEQIKNDTQRKTAGRTMSLGQAIRTFGLDKNGSFFATLAEHGFKPVD